MIRGRNSGGKREVQRGKLFACESKTFSTTAAARETSKKKPGKDREPRFTGLHQSPGRSAADRHSFIREEEEDMKTGKKSFIGRRSFNSACYEIVGGIMCSLSVPQQARMHLETCNFGSSPTQISKYHLFYLPIQS